MSDSLRKLVLDTAQSSGKFPASRREHYEALWANDPTATAELIARLVPALAPAASLPSGGYQAVGPEEYVSTHLTAAERDRIEAAREGRQYSRVVKEL